LEEVRVASRNPIAMLLVAAGLLLLATAPSAHAAYPGRPGVIVFSLTVHEGNESGAGGTATGGLYALRPRKGTVRPLTTNPKDVEPSFAPSGRKLAFVRRGAQVPGQPYETTSICTLDLRTGAVKQLTSGYDDLDPSFGRNGMIVFSRYEPSSKTSYLVLRTRDGRLRRLSSGLDNDRYPVFTANGRRIVFVRTNEAEWPLTTLTSIRLDGRDAVTLGHQRVVSYLDISPDGRLLAFNAAPELKGRVTVGSWTWPVAGGPLRPLAHSGWHPAFSPSGRKIVYSNDAGLWLRPARRHGPPRQIFRTDYDFESGNGTLATDPTWQPLR
jgi:Tol biopolymer transport system component